MTLDVFLTILKNNSINESNKLKNQKHEKTFANFFIDNNFVQIDKKSEKGKKIKTFESLSFHEEYVNELLFIYQPFGSQQSPDFIFLIDGWVIWVELKRSKNKNISWNTGYPKDNVLYIFDSEKLGRIIFLGKFHPVYGGREKEYLEYTNSLKLKSEECFSGTVFKHYYRKMLNDSGEYDKELLFNKTKEVISNLL